MLKVENVSKSFMAGSVKALKNVSITFPDAGFVAIVGESGSGKTTLINVIGGIEKADEGKIEYCSSEAVFNYNNNSEMHSLYKKYYTYVLQENVFVNEMNLLDNIRLAGMVADGKVIAEDDVRFQTLISKAKLSERLNHHYYEVSGGQRQRATLIRGVAKDARVIFADEPTASQDEESERRVFEILREEAEDKLVIMVTHSKTLAYEYCDRIIELYNGECVRDDAISHNITENVIINEDCVTINNPAEMDLNSWNRIKSAVVEHSKISLEIGMDSSKKDCIKQEKVSSKDLQKHTETTNYKNKIFICILKNRIIKCFLFSLAFSLMVSFVFFIKAITRNTCDELFKYDIVCTNDLKEWFFIGPYYDDENVILDFYKNMTGTMVEPIIPANLSLDNVYASPELQGIDGVTGIRIYEPESKVFIEGETKENAFVISDFFAKALIKQGTVYIDYSDIITKGIQVGGKKIAVSGIIETDYYEYERYLELDELDETQMVKRKEFIDRKNNCYQTLYMSNEMYTQLLAAKENPYVIAKLEHHSFITVKVDNNLSDREMRSITINSTLAAMHNYSDLLHALNITSDCEINVLNDGSEQPTVYVSKEYYSNKYNYGYNQYCFVTEEPVCFDDFLYLLQNGNTLITHMDEEIFKYSKFVEVLTELLNNSIWIIIVIMAIVLSSIPGVFSNSLRKTIGLLKLWGADFKDILQLETYFGIVEWLMITITYLVFEIVFSAKGGRILSNAYGIALNNIADLDIIKLFITLGYSAFIAAVLIIVISLIRYKVSISKQVFIQ